MLTSEDLYSEDYEENIEENNEIVENNEDQPQQQQQQQEDEDNQTAPRTIKPKRTVRNPQPKLNDVTLKGARGLAALPSYFERVKFKGKGSEEQDLNVLLKTYEYWCHRLFPKFPFDDCIARIEKLGTKRPIQTHLKRMRMGLDDSQPIINADDHEQNDGHELSDNEGSCSQSIDVPSVGDISREQEERIRLNRERAQRLRDEKLRAMHENQPGTSQSNPDTSIVADEENIDAPPTQEIEAVENTDKTADRIGEKSPDPNASDSDESIENILDKINADDA